MTMHASEMEEAEDAFNAGRFDDAERILEGSLVRVETGADEAALAQHLRLLGSALRQNGRYGRAEEVLRRAARIFGISSGPCSSDFAECLEQIAGVVVQRCIPGDRSKLREAERLVRQALTLNTEIHGDQSSEVANDLNTLGWIYLFEEVKWGLAEQHLSDALSIAEGLGAKACPCMPAILDNLACLARRRREMGKAEALYLRSFEINIAAFGIEHPEVAYSLTTR
jgi:tetratricopeptide (TPR) repeat protein